MTEQPFLKIERLSKRFGAFTALKDIDLEVRRGEFVCFLGPSGCGKTTLSRAPPADRDFGIVFQSYALFPNLTVAQNVGYGLVNRRKGAAEIKRRVDELLALVGMPEQGRKYPIQLSGGQQQRVALARALATSPGLLLLDEPLSALDAKVRVRLRDEIRALQQRLGVTTIMVTHDQEEALTMADRIVVMNQGAIEQVGTPSDIYRAPETPFVADFVGHMTFLDAVATGPGTVRVGSLELAVTGNVAADTPNRFDARIARIAFLGSFCRAQLSPTASPGTTISADFSTNAMRDLGIVEGETRTVAFPPDSLRVFPARESA